MQSREGQFHSSVTRP
nr:unnamed protein product [Callosobruchus chinensis]